MAAVIIVLALAYFLPGRRTATRGALPPGADRFTSIFRFMTADPGDEPVDPSKIETYEMEEERFIRRVVLEKSPVCAGEDFLVTVEASNPNGSDSGLLVRIGNRPGNPAVLRFSRPGEREFYVAVRDEGRRVEYRKVTVNVQDCGGRPSVYMRASLHATKPETAEFEVIDTRGLAGGRTYDWDFGDGTRRRTATGFVSHSYGLREQSALQSTFTASVTVTDGNRKQAVGRATVSFPNIHYISKMTGSPVIPVIYDRFPVFAGGRYEAAVTMKNIFDEAVTFDGAEIEYRPCDSSVGPLKRAVGAATMLSGTSIPGKSSLEDRLVFSRTDVPKGTCNIIVRLTGRMAGDTEVTASIYLDIPPGAGGTAGGEGRKDQAEGDAEIIEKLNRAAEILGKDRPITPDDIRRLEKEGKI